MEKSTIIHKRFSERFVEHTEERIGKQLIKATISNKAYEISDEEVEFFRQNPEQLEIMTNPIDAKKRYLSIAALIGLVLVLISIFYQYYPIFNEDTIMHEFIVQVTFEGGVSLWGVSLTVYLLEVLLEKQNRVNRNYRKRVLKRIAQKQRESTL